MAMAQVGRPLPAHTVNIAVTCIVVQHRALAAHNGQWALGVNTAGVSIFHLPDILSRDVGHCAITVPSPANAALMGDGRRESASTTRPTPTSSASCAARTFFFMRPPAISIARSISARGMLRIKLDSSGKFDSSPGTLLRMNGLLKSPEIGRAHV